MKIKRIDSHLECLYSTNLACQRLLESCNDTDLILELKEILNIQYDVLVDYIEDSGSFTCDDLSYINNELETNYIVFDDNQYQM